MNASISKSSPDGPHVEPVPERFHLSCEGGEEGGNIGRYFFLYRRGWTGSLPTHYVQIYYLLFSPLLHNCGLIIYGVAAWVTKRAENYYTDVLFVIFFKRSQPFYWNGIGKNSLLEHCLPSTPTPQIEEVSWFNLTWISSEYSFDFTAVMHLNGDTESTDTQVHMHGTLSIY
jgi:hypothetical protein